MKSGNLKIYITDQCSSCLYAADTARKIEQIYPNLRVELIDIDHTPEAVPEAVFATPTYMLNNRVMSLGNPGMDDVARWVQELEMVEAEG